MASFAVTQSCMWSSMTLGLSRSLSPTSIQIRIGFGRRVGDEVFGKLKGTVRRFGMVRPLLIYPCAGVGKNAMVKFRVIPRHDQGAGGAGAAAHGCAALGILRQQHVKAGLDLGKHFGLDEIGVASGHGVVFKTAFAALGVASAVRNRDGDHGRNAVLGNQVVQNGK